MQSANRDLGDVDRYAFYDHMKVYLAAPPDVLRCNEKNIREYAVVNVCGVIFTRIIRRRGCIYHSMTVGITSCGRRGRRSTSSPVIGKSCGSGTGMAASSMLRRASGSHLSQFDPKAPTLKTSAFWDIVDANRAPENAELADALDDMKDPRVVTLAMVAEQTTGDLRLFLMDRKNARQIPHRMGEVGYRTVSQPYCEGWPMEGRR